MASTSWVLKGDAGEPEDFVEEGESLGLLVKAMAREVVDSTGEVLGWVVTVPDEPEVIEEPNATHD